MKKILISSAAATTLALGFGGAASASDHDGAEAYPPAAPVDPVAPAAPASGGMLPQTGSDGLSSTITLGGGILIVGLGMVGVTALRRRQDDLTVA